MMFCCTTLAVLQDQPERRGNNNMSLGSATFAARWRHSVNIGAVVETLPCCMNCTTFLITNNKLNDTCNECLGWDTMKASYKPPANYPIVGGEQNTTLDPFVITYRLLREAVTAVNKGIVTRTMTTCEYFCVVLNTSFK
jgi:hypothetical protein